MLAASITRLQPAPTLAASTQHPHLQPALTLASSTHACSQHDTHPSPMHSRVFSKECNSNNFSRIQHNVVAARTHACSQHPRLQPAPALAASTHPCSQHPCLQPAPTLAASTYTCSRFNNSCQKSLFSHNPLNFQHKTVRNHIRNKSFTMIFSGFSRFTK